MSSELIGRSPFEDRDSREDALPDQFIPPWEDEVGVRAFLDQRAGTRCEYYGAGKVALRDALDILSAHANAPKTNVVLPAYVPSALLEPIKDAGYAPRLHRITRELRPDLPDVESQIDTETLALISVNYFGFSQPDHSALVGHAADYDVPLIEDNAHSVLSMTREGTLLGTRGDIGFTSFRKTLPVPNGAALFVWRKGLREGPFPRSGIRRRLTASDGRFLLGHLVRSLGSGTEADREDPWHPGALVDGRDLFGRDPHAVYVESSRPMSRLSAVLLDRLRPAAIVAKKRHNYRRRWHVVSDLDGVRPVFGSLPPGTCPKAIPVLVDDPEALAPSLGLSAGTLPRWPPLPIEVATSDRFETSRYLAENLVPLPV